MKFKSVILFSVLAFLVFSINLQAQIVGKIFSKSEANTLFGPVLQSKTMNVSELNSIISQTNNYVMFLIKNGDVAIKGDGGNIIYNSGLSILPDDVFMKYSKIIVNKLFNLSTDGQVSIERRANVISITTNEWTLEEGLPCPPEC